MSLWLLGLPDQALARGQNALAMTIELNEPFGVARGHLWLAFVCQFRRDARRVHGLTEAALTVATEQGFAIWAGMAMTLRGWALAMQHRSEEGLLELQQGMAAWHATGARLWHPFYCTLQAEVLDLLGRREEALQALDEAQTTMEKTEERWWEAEIYRLRGALLLRHAKASQAEAESWFRRALDVARSQKAKSLELRAATSLARLSSHHGNCAQALDLLGPVYGWFTEGFDTVDLKDAKSLIAQMSA
jgi:predicted ATPase